MSSATTRWGGGAAGGGSSRSRALAALQDLPPGLHPPPVPNLQVILHYAYSYLSDVASKAHRSCPESHLEAARAGDASKARRHCAVSCRLSTSLHIPPGPTPLCPPDRIAALRVLCD